MARIAAFVGLLLACLPGALHAQGFIVAGRVLDATSSVALARATVSLRPVDEAPQQEQSRPSDPTADVTTGPDGSFQFPAVPAGRYLLQASRRGYLTASLEQHGRFYAAVVVGPGHPETTRLRMRLIAFAGIRGTVLDSSGDPVEAAVVHLFRVATDGTGRMLPWQNTSVERGSSSYSFTNLQAGTYYLAITGRPWYADTQAPQDGSANLLDVAYPVTYFESADSAAGAQPVVLKAGETAQANCVLHAVPAVHLATPLTRQDGGIQVPQLSASIFGNPVPVGIGAVSRSAAAGGAAAFSVSIAPGTYTVRNREGSTTVQASADTTLPTDTQSTPAAGLSGKVAMADGSPLVSGVAMRLVADVGAAGSGADGEFPTPRFEAGFGAGFGGQSRGDRSGFEREGGFSRRPIDITVQPDGGLSAKSVPAGNYRLAVSAGAGSAVVTGAAASGGNYTSAGILQVGAEPMILAVTIALANSTVTGRVSDSQGQPQPGVLVALLPRPTAAQPEQTQPPAEAESATDGSWSIAGLVAGTYRAVAVDEGWALPAGSPQALAQYAAAGVEVTVPAGTSVNLPAALVSQAR